MLAPLLITVLSLAFRSFDETQAQPQPYRLPLDVIPQHYKLNVLTDLDQFLFSGLVKIKIKCKNLTDKIKLHSSDLDIGFRDVFLKHSSNNGTVPITKIYFEPAYNFLVIDLKENLEPGLLYILHIPFRGSLKTNLKGYYRTSYRDEDTNTTKWLAVTQFQVIDARRAFPCFDEPAFKATFSISLGHKPSLTAVSNMPLINSCKKDGWIWDDFDVTVPMSTYLVAFMVSDFEFKESDPEPNMVTIRSWTHKDILNQVEFSRKYGPKILNFLEHFFNVRYPLAKLDLVALPEFIMGAMENWGLVTFRDITLLLDEHASTDRTRLVAKTLAHELAHQWFGNLVTMEWWTGIWLNEGFATYISDLTCQRLFPEWNNYKIEVANNILRVFSLDALKTSHPVLLPVSDPSMLFEIFDDVSYKKGSLLLHMINSILGEDIFRAGINNYLNKFKFKNTEQDDLWAALTEAADGKHVLPSKFVTMKHVMDTWTLQTGYPVLGVKRDGGKITITQKRFYSDPSKNVYPLNMVNECWWVPVTFSTAKELKFNETRSSHWLNCESELSIDTGAGPDDWITLNNKAAGIYRVNYDTHSWQLLSDALQVPAMTQINELNRMLIVADVMALAEIGQLDYSLAFQILKYIKNENAFLPWKAATASFKHLEVLLWRTVKYINFQKFMRHILSDVYKNFDDLSYMPKNLEKSSLKVQITSWACNYQVGNCSDNAQKLFRAWMASDSELVRIPEELHSVVFCEGVKQGGEPEWTHVWEKYLHSNITTDKELYMYALSCTRNKYLLKRYLEMSLDESSGIKRQDADFVFTLVAMNSQLGHKVARRFMENNIQRLHDFFADENHLLGKYFTSIARMIVFVDEFEKMKKFLKDNEKLFVSSILTASQALERAHNNLLWMKTFYKSISNAFEVI